MVVVPDVSPFTTPDVPIVATTVFVLLHTPPLAASVNAVDELAQTLTVPLMVPAAGNGLTVTAWVAAVVTLPLVTVYDIVVVPEVRPLTTPEVPTVATMVLVLLHAPPVAASANAVDKPAHTVAVPVIVPAPGAGLTVTTIVAATVPQLFVAV